MPPLTLDAKVLLAIHAHASPLLDNVFGISHWFGISAVCAPLVVSLAVWHARRGERTAALTWIAVGLAAILASEVVKPIFHRLRPALWPRLKLWIPLAVDPYSFPSGHSIAAAALYPLLAYDLARRWPRHAPWLYALGVFLALFTGFGRMYLGVHWPSDVLAGWLMGACLSFLGIRQLRSANPPA
jgi:membrane-associated phospholipid phosphatase